MNIRREAEFQTFLFNLEPMPLSRKYRTVSVFLLSFSSSCPGAKNQYNQHHFLRAR